MKAVLILNLMLSFSIFGFQNGRTDRIPVNMLNFSSENSIFQRVPDSAKAGVLPLSAEDFITGDLSPDIKLKTLRTLFGQPDSIIRAENPFDEASIVSSWLYKDIIFTFIDDTIGLGYSLLNNRFSTKRGLSVGDPISKMFKLYGENNSPSYGEYDYVDANDETHLIRITIEKDKVKEIYLGYILD